MHCGVFFFFLSCFHLPGTPTEVIQLACAFGRGKAIPQNLKPTFLKSSAQLLENLMGENTISTPILFMTISDIFSNPLVQ